MMKQSSLAIALVLVLTMLFPGAAWADEPAGQSPAEKNAYLEWLGDSWSWVSGKLQSGYDKIDDAVAEVTGQTLDEWRETAEAYLMSSNWPEEVRSAWKLLREGAGNAGSVAAEEATEAYHTVRDWLISNDVLTEEDMAAALDWIAGAAGVTEAALSGWYRIVENYLAEHRDAMSETVREAWDVIRQAQAQGFETAGDALKAAYRTVYDWIASAHTDDAERAAEAMEHIMAL